MGRQSGYPISCSRGRIRNRHRKSPTVGRDKGKWKKQRPPPNWQGEGNEEVVTHQCSSIDWDSLGKWPAWMYLAWDTVRNTNCTRTARSNMMQVGGQGVRTHGDIFVTAMETKHASPPWTRRDFTRCHHCWDTIHSHSPTQCPATRLHHGRAANQPSSPVLGR